MKAIIKKVFRRLSKSFSSSDYWESRYQSGGNSGSGSYRHLAKFKADFLNEFIATHKVSSAIEFGCGDGNQLSLINYPTYIGLDVSKTSIQMCSEKFNKDGTKKFLLYDPFSFSIDNVLKSDASLSLDVIYHLIEDKVFDLYMHHLFATATRFVIVYSTNEDLPRVNHERGRNFTYWIEQHQPAWKLLKITENPFKQESDPDERSFADFYVYLKA